MKQNRNEIYVYAGWEEDKKIGTIYSNVINGEEVVSFEYDPGWLGIHPELVLDPEIPLSPYREYSKDKMLFGAFTDSCPDRWGRKLIERREAEYASREGRSPRKFFETDYLLAVQDSCRNGGLRYTTADDTEFVSHDDLPIPPITSIRELEQISLGYESNRDNRWVERLVYPGSSLGGARPKSNVTDVDGTLWIA
jgi:serine/threonine-protein kinase HipA